jgi:hypothetical protein
MTLSAEQDQKTPGIEDDLWEGEPITLSRSWGDLYLHGVVGHRVSFPGRHLHPQIRRAAEQVQKATAEREALEREIAARTPARDQLVAKLAPEVREAGPGRVKAAHELKSFDAETELLSILIPDLDAAVRQSWDELVAALTEIGGDWDRYLHRRGREAVAALQGAVQALQTALDECQLIDALLAREGIVSSAGAATPEDFETRFARGQRGITVGMLVGGEDRGSEGRRYGLEELAAEYERSIA